MKNKIFVLGAVLIAVIAFVVFKISAGNSSVVSPPATAPTTSIMSASFVRPHSPTFGNAKAKVTVVEWFDPECESCRIFHPVVKKIIAEYKDRVFFVLRYMPYHPNSLYAASALEEAREMGKFEKALDILFEKQPIWGDHHQPRPDLIPEYLSKLGIPKNTLEAETMIKRHGEKIQMDAYDGNALGVTGTPTFFVNGQMVQELDEKVIRLAIEKALVLSVE